MALVRTQVTEGRLLQPFAGLALASDTQCGSGLGGLLSADSATPLPGNMLLTILQARAVSPLAHSAIGRVDRRINRGADSERHVALRQSQHNIPILKL
jgi:hypothetical protein